jgi:hypothetical protein
MGVHYDRDAREILAEMTAGKTEAEYRDFIWSLREPVKPKRSSSGWPYRGLEINARVVTPAGSRRLRATFEVIK